MISTTRTAALIVILLAAALAPVFADGRVRIAVLKSREVPQYNTALTGFKKALAEKGYTCEILPYDLKLDEAEGRRACVSLTSLKPDLVLALGSMATETAKANLKDLPVVFSMVLNPADNGFVASMDAPGGSITGASMDIPVEEQFRQMKAVVPGLRRIGVLYNPSETGRSVDQAKAAAQALGLELAARPVASEKDVPSELAKIGKEIDALWAVADSTVFSIKGTQFVMLFTLRNRVPFMGISAAFVRAGALMALSTDDEDIGRQSGETAIEIFRGRRPGDIPVTVPRRTFLALNLNVARQIQLTVPPETVKKAKQVFQ